jgi:WD40 repeat protein
MKSKRVLMILLLFITATFIFIAGCKYDVSEPLWYQPYTTPPTPAITQVTPAEATPGINRITILGENFLIGTGTTTVSFNNTPAEIISVSENSITVRRPNIVSDSSKIKVIVHDALSEPVYGPYKVSPVIEQYGSFLTGVQLGVVAVDNSENLYVVETLSRDVHKVTPDGENTVISTATRAPFDGKIGPDGNLYLTENNRAVDKVDFASGATARWIQLPSGKVVKFCDFGSNGFFYAGGSKTGIVIVPFDLSKDPVSTTDYLTDDIEAIRVYNGYIYVASKPLNSFNPAVIYKHQVNADGSIGSQEKVFDMNSIQDSSVVSGLTFSTDGMMFIATSSADNTMIAVDPADNSTDVYYKGILRPYCASIYWGNGDYLYMINGNSTSGEVWNVYRIDMGKKGAPYY